MNAVELIRALPADQVDDYIAETYGDKNTLQVVKHERQHGKLRQVSDELNAALTLAPAVVRMDEIRTALGMAPKHLPNMLNEFGGGKLVGVSFNLRTNAGIDYAADALGKSSSRPAVAEYIAVTADTAAPAAGDTTLASEVSTSGLNRQVATYAHTTTATSYTLTKAFSASGTVSSLVKAGLFNASSSGTMYLETAFTSASVTGGDTLTLTWTVNI